MYLVSSKANTLVYIGTELILWDDSEKVLSRYLSPWLAPDTIIIFVFFFFLGSNSFFFFNTLMVLFFFKFFPYLDCYIILGRVPCAIQ